MTNLISVFTLTLISVSSVLVIIEQISRVIYVRKQRKEQKEVAQASKILNVKNETIKIEEIIKKLIKVNNMKTENKVAFIIGGKTVPIIDLIFTTLVASGLDVYRKKEIENINCDNYDVIFDITVNK